MEQMLRAQAFHRLGFVTLLEPQKLSGEKLAHSIIGLLNTKKRIKKQNVNFQGIKTAAREILQFAFDKGTG
jgi:predicted glycosyltransferase